MKFLHIIKTSSFLSDGRLLKWISSLNENSTQSNVYIIEDQNLKKIEENVYYDKLWFRKMFKQRSGYLFKVIEYCIRFTRFIKNDKQDYNYIIFHDVQQYFNLLVYHLFWRNKINSKSVWDLHELPHSLFEKNNLSRNFIKFLIQKCDIVIYTNLERKSYIYNIYQITTDNFYILNNYPDNAFLKLPKSRPPSTLSNFKEKKPYIIWLGAAEQSRNFSSFLNAYDTVSHLYNLVLLGKVNQMFLPKINQLTMEGKVYNNFVPQSELMKYIDNAEFSVVLYKSSTSMNNLYCEPNRLYQLISRRVPVIVGNNPTMKEVVKRMGVGIVLKDDGNDPQLMIDGLNLLFRNLSKIHQDYRDIDVEMSFSWENQFNKMFFEKFAF